MSTNNSDIVVPIISSLATVLCGFVLYHHIRSSHGTYKAYKAKQEIAHQKPDIKLYCLWTLSHLSMLFMIMVPILITFTFISSNTSTSCQILWVSICCVYTYSLYLLKWTYLVRAYQVFCSLSPTHGCIKIIKIMFVFQIIIAMMVTIGLILFLRGDDINDKEEIPCQTSFNWELVAVIPICLMLFDLAVFTIFSTKLVQLIRNQYSIIKYKKAKQLEAAVILHYFVTITCISLCLVDYIINIIFMDRYKKLISVIFDASAIIICNYLLFNSNMEPKFIAFVVSKLNISSETPSKQDKNGKGSSKKKVKQPKISTEKDTNFSSLFLSGLTLSDLEKDISSAPEQFTWSSPNEKEDVPNSINTIISKLSSIKESDISKVSSPHNIDQPAEIISNDISNLQNGKT